VSRVSRVSISSRCNAIGNRQRPLHSHGLRTHIYDLASTRGMSHESFWIFDNQYQRTEYKYIQNIRLPCRAVPEARVVLHWGYALAMAVSPATRDAPVDLLSDQTETGKTANLWGCCDMSVRPRCSMDSTSHLVNLHVEPQRATR
jgi:hypothetical protein